MTLSVGSKGNGLKITCTGNLHRSVASGENLRSIGSHHYVCEGLIYNLLESRSRLSFWQEWANIHFQFYFCEHHFFK